MVATLDRDQEVVPFAVSYFSVTSCDTVTQIPSRPPAHWIGEVFPKHFKEVGARKHPNARGCWQIFTKRRVEVFLAISGQYLVSRNVSHRQSGM